MKKIIEKLQAAEQAERHARAEEAKINAQNYARSNEKIHERAQKQVNNERRGFLDMLGKAGIASSLKNRFPSIKCQSAIRAADSITSTLICPMLPVKV